MYSGGFRGGAGPPPYFWTKLRPKGLKKIFWETAPPPYLRLWMTSLPPLISRSGSGTAVAGKMAILLLRIQGKSQGYGECLPTVLDFSDKWKLKIVDICDCSGWSGRNQENLERVSFFPTSAMVCCHSQQNNVNSNLCCQGCWWSMTDYFC